MKKLLRCMTLGALSLMCALFALPGERMNVLAGEYGLWIGSTEVTEANKDGITLPGGGAKYDPDSGTLTFTGSVTGVNGLHEGAQIYAEKPIILQGKATLNNTAATYGLFTKDKMRFTGKDTYLEFYGTTAAVYERNDSPWNFTIDEGLYIAKPAGFWFESWYYSRVGQGNKYNNEYCGFIYKEWLSAGPIPAQEVVIKPGTAYNYWLGDIPINSDNMANIPVEEGFASYDPAEGVLTLQNVTKLKWIDQDSKWSAIYLDNSLSAPDKPLIIRGTADLRAEGCDYGYSEYDERGEFYLNEQGVILEGDLKLSGKSDVISSGGPVSVVPGANVILEGNFGIRANTFNMIGGNLHIKAQTSALMVTGMNASGGILTAESEKQYGVFILETPGFYTQTGGIVSLIANNGVGIRSTKNTTGAVCKLSVTGGQLYAKGEEKAVAFFSAEAPSLSSGMKTVIPENGYIGTKGTNYYYGLTADNQYSSEFMMVPADAKTVSFDKNGAEGENPITQAIANGKTAYEPDDFGMKKEGFVLEGWYTDAACTSRYDFSKPVTGDLTLFAKWVEEGKTPETEPGNPGEKSGPVSVSAKANPMSVTAKAVKIKYAKVKKKNQKIAANKALSVKGAEGTLSYQLVSVKKSKFKKYFKVNAKTGKITVKKKLKKGTYKLKISVKAAGNDKYKAAEKTVTVKVKVK